jgi:hypothetical protein
MSINVIRVWKIVLLVMSCSINVNNFGSRLKSIASKRTNEREERKKQITKSDQCKTW